VTESGARAAQDWRDPSIARAWAGVDELADLLTLPRLVTAELVAADGQPSLVVDVASGPGAFLATLLDEFPNAQGVWTDASPAMRDIARERLAGYDGRVEFVLADMTDLPSAGLPRDVDVVVSSRASHHLDAEGLRAFYRGVVGLLRPGGWLANLDHVATPAQWDARLRAARQRFRSRERADTGHRHDRPLPTLADHLAALADAGVPDAEVAWRAFVTCLVVGQRPA
jgi:trans-aconitate methyltransferase